MEYKKLKNTWQGNHKTRNDVFKQKLSKNFSFQKVLINFKVRFNL